MLRSFFALLLIPAGLITAQELKPVALPASVKTGGKPFMQVLNERKSARAYTDEKFSPQALSNLLWAAWGINRPDGRRTAPSAANRQEVEIYVVLAEGAYLWDAKANVLNPVVSGDLRKVTGSQEWIAQAPVNLIFVADFTKLPGSEIINVGDAFVDTGYISQNIYLYCASEGNLGTVARGSVPRDPVAKALNLKPTQRVTIAQTVGYLKK
jgi:nitroreductase